MNTEFTTELKESGTLRIPREVAKNLPCSGTPRIIFLSEGRDGDRAWQAAAYTQFVRDDAPEDAIYDSF